MKYPECILTKGKDKQLKTFHPWVFSGALAGTFAEKKATIVKLRASDGSFLAWGQYNPNSSIRVRILSLNENEEPTIDWYRAKIRAALLARQAYQGPETTACRLIYAESDGLPGLIVDRLADTLLVQFVTAMADQEKAMYTELLAELAPECIPTPFSLACIYERSDGDGRKMEGLPPVNGALYGELPGEYIEFVENGMRLHADPRSQKTGFYCDQRDNRQRVAAYAKGKSVLDVCCFSGAFSAAAAAQGARDILLFDASQTALKLAEENVTRNIPANSPQPPTVTTMQADMFEGLRVLKAEAKRFDLIILDPPKLAPNRSSLSRAASGYKDLNLQALSLLAPGGVLATFSCSGLVSTEDFQKYIAWAAKDAGIRAYIIDRLTQAPCHPVPLGFPESEYLKGFIIRT